jgi:predicted nucleic acid-binding protein
MILVDSSVWIDFFNDRETAKTSLLAEILPDRPVWTGDLILVEVLAGFRHDRDLAVARELMAGLEYADLLGADVAASTIHNYRRLRARGVTVRSLVDVMIASFCVARDFSLLHSDRDFDAMAPHIGLRTL